MQFIGKIAQVRSLTLSLSLSLYLFVGTCNSTATKTHLLINELALVGQLSDRRRGRGRCNERSRGEKACALLA